MEYQALHVKFAGKKLNETDEFFTESVILDQTGDIASAVFLVLLLLFVFFVNLALIVTIFSSRSLRQNNFYVLLVNLCVMCILDSLFNVAFSAFYVLNRTEVGSAPCVFNSGMMPCILLILTWGLVLLWFDRIVYLRSSSWYDKFLEKPYKHLIIIATFDIFTMLLISSVWMKKIASLPFRYRYSCSVTDSSGFGAAVLVLGYGTAWFFMLICILIVAVLYLLEYRKHKRNEQMEHDSKLSYIEVSSNLSEERSNILLLFAVLVLYIVFIMPHVFTVHIGLWNTGEAGFTAVTVQTTFANGTLIREYSEIVTGVHDSVFVWLRYIFSAIVPLLTFIFIKDIRKKSEALFCRCRSNTVNSAFAHRKIPRDSIKGRNKKGKLFKSRSSNEKTPVLLATSEGLHLQVPETDSGSESESKKVEPINATLTWSPKPKFRLSFCDVKLPMDDDDDTTVPAEPSTPETPAESEKPDAELSPKKRSVRFSNVIKEIPPIPYAAEMADLDKPKKPISRLQRRPTGLPDLQEFQNSFGEVEEHDPTVRLQRRPTGLPSIKDFMFHMGITHEDEEKEEEEEEEKRKAEEKEKENGDPEPSCSKTIPEENEEEITPTTGNRFTILETPGDPALVC